VQLAPLPPARAPPQSPGTVADCPNGAGREPEPPPGDPHLAAGAHDFVQFAYAACRRKQSRGGVSQFVPALKPIRHSLTVRQLTTIIRCGAHSTGQA